MIKKYDLTLECQKIRKGKQRPALTDHFKIGGLINMER